MKELQTLVDDRAYNPAIDIAAFPAAPTTFFWSSSPYAGNTGYAWVVSFSYGYVNNNGVGNDYRVRCVR
ncbi:MAG: DUF1566 domain-containing protein [Deltaproteobacteria bacterium]|nr:DUF1566 domain-containing protein [Deltaproteobacteria bacterium]